MYPNYRLMSFVIAAAINTIDPTHENREQILKYLVLPDFVKEDPNVRLKAYLQAITLNGYSKKKIRKVTILGNKGN